MAKAKIPLDLLGELVVGLRDEMRELKATGQKQHNIVVRMLRRIEDRLDRHDELLISLLQSDHDLERRLRAAERAKEGE